MMLGNIDVLSNNIIEDIFKYSWALIVGNDTNNNNNYLN